MATEIVQGLIRAVLKTSNGNFQSSFFITRDEEGDFKATFQSNQHAHESTDDYQIFDLDGLRELADFLDEVIEHEEETA